MRRRRLAFAVVLGGLLLVGGAIATTAGLRWRVELLGLKAMGKIPELGWLELTRMIRPGGPIYLEPLRRTRNPYVSIRNPDSSGAAVTAGEEGFRRLCSTCHGADARGGAGPPLVGAPLQHGSSDWALYQAISRGFPGTAMRGSRLPESDRWRIAAYLRTLRAQTAPPARRTRSAALERLMPISAQALVDARTDSANWLTYSGAYDGRRYSTLRQIHRGNVQRLRLLWMYQIDTEDRRFETTPLVATGVMFITTPTNGVRALEAETGAVLWAYDRELPVSLRLCCGRVNRGLAILDSTLYLATLDAHLVALDARTGAVRWDVTAADYGLGYSFTSAPLAVADLILIGNGGGEFPTRGFLDAYDATTGDRRWRFATIPAPGSPGNETWSGTSWKTGGAPAWMTGSYDPALDLVYWGLGNPNPDYNGDARLGDNLYSNSIVALDRKTGALRWHFQLTPHDEHDWDANQIPVLVDGPAPAKQPLLLLANKNAFYYVLDRATGRFLRAREFAQQTWAESIDSAGRPVVRAGSAPSRAGVPGPDAATNWWSPTYSPRTGAFYLQTFEREDLYFKGPNLEGARGRRMGSARTPALPGSGRGAIRALDALTGERRWEFETFTGATEWLDFMGGLLSTAGDVVFGAAEDLLLALDAIDGRKLWSFQAGGSVHAAPVTYLVRGRQRLTVAAGHVLLTFGLEEAAPPPGP